jgi:anti-sigma factor RsiW
MDCCTFRENHAQFVDGLVADEELVAMQRHVAECGGCAAHDAAIRRAILLFRNMPVIEPSPEFGSRLQARLRAERREQRARATAAGYGGPGLGAFAALAAGLVAAGLVVMSALGGRGTVPPVRLTPVVVAAAPHPAERARTIVAAGAPVPVPDSELPDANDPATWSPLSDPAFAASVSTGMPVWPAAVLAAQPPATLSSPMKLTNLER